MSVVAKLDRLLTSPWLRPPWWRWLLASELRYLPADQLRKEGVDEYIRDAAMYYVQRVSLGKKFVRRQQDLETAHDLWRCNLPGSYRWWLEAAICAGLDDAAIVGVLPFSPDPRAIHVYRKTFFDIDDNRTNPIYLCAGVLNHSFTDTLKHGLMSNYMWKKVAATWGWETFHGVYTYFLANNPERPPQKILNWIKTMSQDAVDVQATHQALVLAQVFNEQAMFVLKTALDARAVSREQVDAGQSFADNNQVQELCTYLDAVMIDSEAKMPRHEARAKRASGNSEPAGYIEGSTTTKENHEAHDASG